jgi:hypothetical protein
MITLAVFLFSIKGLLLALAGTGFVLGYSHQGSFDASAIADSLTGEDVSTSAAVTAGGTFPANALTGAGTVVFTNTTGTPGTLTTRTANQMYNDLSSQLGVAPPLGYQYLLIIIQGAAGTLTVAAGTGVTLSSLSTGPTTIATVTSRAFVMTFTNANTVTMQAIGALAT